ncbi:hypothetical protein CYQ88_11205 [Hydrogenovibrio sp. SC-1]|uniref:hypothetical protein n=1 Tax=Hydrogenovibrio sp. SC-1 TaxID=2065820 RepID=UPI000C7D8B2C|nr:hypothetical protein [Hydrogenovibrio sp. SC-1]PLA73450.1 hypothetical protein CYQ88_11205 [Hydrogenovibrio sp. SC-1]
MSNHDSSKKLLKNVQSILPIIKQGAEASEQDERLQPAVLDAIFEQRLFRLFIPKKYNGEATDLVTALKVFESVASADGATGWLVMIGAGGGLFSGFIEEGAAEEIFAPERAVISGSGMPSGVAKPMNQGFEVSGRWKYASGSDYATWFTANCVMDEVDNEILSIAVPASAVTRYSTWKVFGMKATGSHDFSVDSVEVPKAYTFSLAEKPFLSDPIYFCSLEVLAYLTFTSVAIGIAQHALEEFMAFAQQRSMQDTTTSLLDASPIQQQCDQAQKLVTQSRNQLYQRAEQVWEAAQKQQTSSAELTHKIHEESIDIVQNCVQMVDGLKARSGMLAVFTASPFGRAWRDLHVLSQHIMLTPPVNK